MTVNHGALAAYAEFACAAATAAGAAILPHFRAPISVDDKGGARGYDPVTEADRAAETVIRGEIARAWPGHGIHGEEHGREPGRQPWTWVIDPIDGTRSFILGQLHWGTLIALHDGTRPVVGVTHQPFVGETFVGIAGGQSQWRRGNERRTLRTRACPRIADAVVATTDPRHFQAPRQRAAYAVATDGARMVRYGGDCYCYTQLAMGLVDIVIETGLQPYDVQSLIPLIESAGGVITSWTGAACDDGGDVLACGDPSLHAALLGRMPGDAP
jgi:myo-inositol-1(or 4)-monophosphatase